MAKPLVVIVVVDLRLQAVELVLGLHIKDTIDTRAAVATKEVAVAEQRQEDQIHERIVLHEGHARRHVASARNRQDINLVFH